MELTAGAGGFLLVAMGAAWCAAVTTGAWILERWRFKTDASRNLFRFVYLTLFFVSLALILEYLGSRIFARQERGRPKMCYGDWQ